MRAVGIRELKDRLSEYLRRVRAGEEILVTDRGQVIAVLRPPAHVPSGTKIPPGLAALAREGLLTLGGPNNPHVYPALTPLLKTMTVKDLLDADRGPD